MEMFVLELALGCTLASQSCYRKAIDAYVEDDDMTAAIRCRAALADAIRKERETRAKIADLVARRK